MKSFVAQTKQYIDSAAIDDLTAAAHRYEELARYKPYQIEFAQDEAAVMPFAVVPVGPEGKESVLMHLTDSTITGLEADITFDTGGGANMMSSEIAEKFNLIPLESS